MGKLVSIVLPTYNGEKYIKEAIESILAQSYSLFELVIVDDCSTDNTYSIVKKYIEKDQRIKLIHNSINKKLPASLNVGFAVAKGSYYTWTSDDNRYKKDAIEALVKTIEEKPHCDLVFSDYDIINEGGHKIGERKRLNDNIVEILYGNIIGACFLYKKEVHEKLGGYSENRFLVEDYDFWLRAYQYFRFVHIDENLYEYRIHNTSLTETRIEDIQRETIKLWIGMLESNKIKSSEKYQIALNIADKYANAIPDFKKRVRYMRLARKYGPCAVEKILIKEWLERYIFKKG